MFCLFSFRWHLVAHLYTVTLNSRHRVSKKYKILSHNVFIVQSQRQENRLLGPLWSNVHAIHSIYDVLCSARACLKFRIVILIEPPWLAETELGREEPHCVIICLTSLEHSGSASSHRFPAATKLSDVAEERDLSVLSLQ